MPRIVFQLRFSVKQRLLKLLRKCREAASKIKILVLIRVSNGRTRQQAADTFQVHRATVYRRATCTRHLRSHGDLADDRTLGREAALLRHRGRQGTAGNSLVRLNAMIRDCHYAHCG
jgi:hypothetical protein